MKHNPLVKEIYSILATPQPWKPMMIERVTTALKQSAEVMKALYQVNKDLNVKLKYHEGMRGNVKLIRNLTILELYENGTTLMEIAREFGLTKQRVQKIVKVTKKYVESEYDPTQFEGIPRESDTRFEGETGSGDQKDCPANPDRRW